ncbi:cytochrome P450 [Saccharothrix tamanrassetensis]|uniref:Cytochrome P450 n=1 Tax=Saccharothrix tamanrassetensis TaxID=1051531 RepID=A0A841CAM2_9PSEU|nr:cytochrome P450 [Saccharothrix tamanrassetensis]MBB5953993.1 cytochrome P450 [Saccharothrix tamanrassetensis]
MTADIGKSEAPAVPGRLPLVGHTAAMLRERLDFTAKLRSYGDVVRLRLGPLAVHFVTTPELAYQVLTGQTDKFDKGILVDKLRRAFGNGLVSTDGEFHRSQRRMIQPAFSRRALARHAEVMTESAGEMVDSWWAGQELALDRRMQDFTISVVGRTLFSADFGPRVGAEIRRYTPTLIRLGVLRALTPSLLSLPVRRRFDNAVAHVHRVVDDVVAGGREDRDDLLSVLLRARDEAGEPMSRQQVRDEVVTLLTAGSETTGIALSWLFHELARNPGVEERLHAEVDEVVGRRAATFEDVPSLVYTQRVISEVLRKYPLWFLMRRANTDVTLGGVRIPAGTEVGFSPHALHHDPLSYDAPARFDPDRWLPTRARSVPRGAYVPFAGGLHHCPGHSYASLEIAIAAATVAARWRLVPVPGKPVHPRVVGLMYPNRLPMIALPRRN